MAKTYQEIQKQIAKLQQEAEVLRQKELQEVIARIREAINHYGITSDDLFVDAGKKHAPVRAKRPAAKKVSAPKYRDEAGNTWSGRGKRPGWFKEAIAAGKNPEELLVR